MWTGVDVLQTPESFEVFGGSVDPAGVGVGVKVGVGVDEGSTPGFSMALTESAKYRLRIDVLYLDNEFGSRPLLSQSVS